MRPTDRVANLYPIADFPTGAFLSVMRSTMIAGLPVVHGLTGSAHSEFKVRNSLARGDRQGAGAAPDRAVGRAELHAPLPRRGARQRFLRRPAGHHLGRADAGGAARENSASASRGLGARAVEIRARYAFTEMQGGLVQCADDAPSRRTSRPISTISKWSTDSGRRLPDGESGMLAITHLHRRGTVLLRYLVGDVVDAVARAVPASAGALGERVVATPRRTGNLVKCRGMLVNTDVVVDLLSAMDGIGQFQLVFARERSRARWTAWWSGSSGRRGAGRRMLRDRLTAGVQRGGVAAARGRVRARAARCTTRSARSRPGGCSTCAPGRMTDVRQ